MKKSLRELCTAIAICFCATGNLFATDNQFNTDHTMDKNLNLIKEWDKVFPQSDKVSHSKVTFRNRYGITLAADMYKPKHADGKLPAIAISGQRFIEHSVDKVARLREMIDRKELSTMIEVDGGVNLETGKRLVDAGANVLVAGNFVFKSPDPIQTIKDLKAL